MNFFNYNLLFCIFAKTIIMNEYPKTDQEIRIWCLYYVRDFYNDKAIEEAQKVYNFICHSNTVEQQVQRKKSLAQKFRSFLLKLRG